MSNTLSKEDLKIRASNVAAALGYNFDSPHMDVINVKDAYCMGYTFGVKEKEEYAKQEAIGFAEWVGENYFLDITGFYHQDYQNKIHYKINDLYPLYQSLKENQP